MAAAARERSYFFQPSGFFLFFPFTFYLLHL